MLLIDQVNSRPFLAQQASTLHLARRIWHAGGVLLITTIYLSVDEGFALQMMGLGTVFVVGLDFLRQVLPPLNSFLVAFMRPTMREREMHGFAGISFMLPGIFLSMILFPPPVVTLALLYLAFADPIAAAAGIRFGRDRLIGRKTLQGTVAAFGTCTIVTFIYIYVTGLMTERALIVSLMGGLIGAVSELVPLGPLDDNFTLPLISSALLLILFYFFGGVA